jgi:CheY-like chemotaxis protein
MNIILSVDDESGILQVRRMVLEQAGYQVLDASDGAEALRIFVAADVDLVLLDYYMPHMDGGQVASEMKRTKPQIPVIMVSASLECFETVRGKVDSFVSKGYGPELLLTEITKFLSLEGRVAA